MSILTDLALSRRPALAFLSIGFFWAAIAAQVPVLKAQIGASDAVYGTIFVLSSAGSMSAMWIAPRFDRMCGRFAVSAAITLAAVAFMFPGLATGVVPFAIAMFFAAGGSGLADVLMNARVSELETRHDRPLMNLNHAVFSFAYAFAALVTGWAREAGWAPSTVFFCVCSFILLLTPFMRERQDHVPVSDEIHETPGHGPGAAVVWLGGLVVLVAFLSESAVEGWSALHLERTLGGTPAQGAMGPAILGLTMGFGRLFGQVIAARVSETMMIGVASLVSALGLLIAAGAGTLALAYVGFGAMGLGVSVVAPMALALVGKSVSEVHRVAAIGRAALIGFMAFSLGPGVVGVSSQMFGLRWSFVIVAVMLVLTAAFLAPRLRRQAVAAE